MWWEGLSLYLTCYKPWFSVLQVLMHCTPSSNPSIHPLLFSHPLVTHRSTYLPSNPQNLPTASGELCSLLSCEGLCAYRTNSSSSSWRQWRSFSSSCNIRFLLCLKSPECFGYPSCTSKISLWIISFKSKENLPLEHNAPSTSLHFLWNSDFKHWKECSQHLLMPARPCSRKINRSLSKPYTQPKTSRYWIINHPIKVQNQFTQIFWSYIPTNILII